MCAYSLFVRDDKTFLLNTEIEVLKISIEPLLLLNVFIIIHGIVEFATSTTRIGDVTGQFIKMIIFTL